MPQTTQVLATNQRTVMDDPFIRQYVEDLLTNVRTQVLLRLIRPYTQVRLPFLARRLNAPLEEVERLLVSLILDGKVEGHLDQVRKGE